MKSKESIDDKCLFNRIFDDPKSTTAQDVSDENHPLYKCKVCPDPINEEIKCPYYRSISLYRVMKIIALEDEVKKLRDRFEGIKYD